MSETKKRRLDGDGGSRKKRKSAAKQEEDDMLDVEAGVNTAVSFMDGQLLSDHLAQKVNRFGSDLSSIELEDLAIPGE
jgi:protein CMS1